MQGLMVVGLTVEEILNVDVKCVKGTGAQNIGQLIVLGFNDTSTLKGHLVSSP